MKKARISIIVFLMLASVAMRPALSAAEPIQWEDLTGKALQKADLPVGGRTVPHPIIKHVMYYFIDSQTLRGDTDNVKKYPGLYRSIDTGKTWTFLLGYFEFKYLFIHPQSSELFAIIQDNALTTNEAGFLTRPSAGKAIRSTNGTQWKDIMGKQQRAFGLNYIVVDSEHPNRVRLVGHAFRPYELIASDDEYSDWRRVQLPTGTPF